MHSQLSDGLDGDMASGMFYRVLSWPEDACTPQKDVTYDTP
jgi:hypothetical protein